MSFADVEPTDVRRRRWNKPTDPVPFIPTVYPAGTKPPPVAMQGKPPMWPVAAMLALGALIAACAVML